MGVMKDTNGISKGFGFVNFSTPEEAREAVQTKNKYIINNEVLCVCRAQKEKERKNVLLRQFEERKREHVAKYHGLNLYVKNFPIDFDNASLEKHFSEFGTITSCKIMYDSKTGLSKGFGFVCFSNASEARRALTEMKTRTYLVKPFYVSLAQTKEARRKQLEMQFRIRTSSQHSIQSLGLLQPFDSFSPSKSELEHTNLRSTRRFVRSRRGNGRDNKHYCCRESAIRGRRISQITSRDKKKQADLNSSTRVYNLEDSRFKPHARQHLSTILASLPEEQRRHRIGEEIYPRVQKLQPKIVGKITGMFLDMEVGELLGLLEN